LIHHLLTEENCLASFEILLYVKHTERIPNFCRRFLELETYLSLVDVLESAKTGSAAYSDTLKPWLIERLFGVWSSSISIEQESPCRKEKYCKTDEVKSNLHVTQKTEKAYT
jgi:hypothetical protein